MDFLEIIFLINAINIIPTIRTVFFTFFDPCATNRTSHNITYRLISTKPNMQTLMPAIWLMETFSLYKKYPTNISTQARPIFATTLAVLTAHPAR